MKKLLLLGFFATILATASLAQLTNFHTGAEYCSKKKIQQGDGLNHNKGNISISDHSFDVLNYQLDLDLMNNYSAPYPASFQANVIIRFRIDSALTSVALNAVNNSISIDSIALNGIGFTHTNNILEVQLDRTYFPGEIAEVQIFYQHLDINDGAIYCSGGFFFTDCEPEGARKWFPCKDSPDDKATVAIKVKVPTDVKLGSNGRLQDSIPMGNSITYQWISRDPIATYLVVITSKVGYNLDIVQWNDTISDQIIPIRFYYNSNENPAPIKNIIGEMAAFYSSEFCDHPFEKNGFSTLNSQFAWGGMENQTLTSLCPGCWGESLVAHEFAHQWFGDMITCATWSDIFLNEGITTWVEAHWTEHKSGYSAYKNELYQNLNNYIYDNSGWAISEPSWAINTPSIYVLFDNAITYMKGSCVMHQLRYVLGDSLFFAGMKAYSSDTNYKYKSATILDFKNKMEVVSEQDLDWFFDEWIFKPNHPIYSNVYSFQESDNGKWIVNFTAKQTVQSEATFWQMPLELQIKFNDHTDTIVKIFNSYNEQIFVFEFGKEPIDLKFDPNRQILLKQGTTVVGTDENASISQEVISVSPDPFTSFTTISYLLSQAENVSIQLFDQLGRKVSSYDLGNQVPGRHSYRIEGHSLKPGIYYIRFISGNAATTRKIMHN